MEIRQRLIDQLKIDEGFRAEAYRDGEGWAIGYGHHTADKPEGPITEAEAEGLLREDIQVAVADCQRVFDDFDAIDPDRQDALINMAYNLGRPRLMQFRKMIAAVNARDFERAADEAGLNAAGTGPSRWVQQTGDRARRIIEVLKP